MNKWRTKESSELTPLRGSVRWRQLREAVLRSNPLCAVCAEKGIVENTFEISTVVDFAISLDFIKSRIPLKFLLL